MLLIIDVILAVLALKAFEVSDNRRDHALLLAGGLACAAHVALAILGSFQSRGLPVAAHAAIQIGTLILITAMMIKARYRRHSLAALRVRRRRSRPGPQLKRF